MIDASAVATEFNTLFESTLSVAQQVDPIKLNQTLAAAAEALDGLGDRFGQSLAHGNEILADLADVYGIAAPDLFDSLANVGTTARTFNQQQANFDKALLSAIGVGNTGADILERGGPYLVRSLADLISTSEILDRNSPALFRSIRNFHDVEPRFSRAPGGNGFSGTGFGTIMGAGNPYVYPDNLPRVNARGGPEGRPGCWQKITRDLWPAPHLVLDTGASIAPVQPLGTRAADVHRICEGTPDRGLHDQPLGRLVEQADDRCAQVRSVHVLGDQAQCELVAAAQYAEHDVLAADPVVLVR